MKHKVSLNIAALALLGAGSAYAVPDACDQGGGLFTGAYRVNGQQDGSFVGRAGDRVGRSMAIGDFNGDGFGDVAFGADGADDNGPDSGVVYVVLSNGTGPDPRLTGVVGLAAHLNYDVVIRGESSFDRAGWSVSNAGDVDGDGLDDLLIGSNATAGRSGGAGMAHLVAGSRISSDLQIDLLTEATATFFGAFRNDLFGSTVAGVGDINGDSFADIAIAARDFSGVRFQGGAVYLWLGPVTGTQNAGQTEYARLDGATQSSGFGRSIASGGVDLNGDLIDDVVVGSPNDGTSGTGAGAVYAWFGGGPTAFTATNPASAADVRYYGRTNDRLGHAVAAAGDIDLDYNEDLWVSAQTRGSFKEGAAFLVRGFTAGGVSSIDPVAVHVVEGEWSNDTLGSSLAVGDFNGDGVSDLLAGGERASGLSFSSGAAWAFYGPFTAGLVTNALNDDDGKFIGTLQSDSVGTGVAVGDVTGDGYDDVFVGGWGADDVTVDGGVTALWSGGADLADLATYYRDVDGDGFGDPANTTAACSRPPGYVVNNDDCNDTSTAFRPGAPEPCGAIDYNCDTRTGNVDGDFDGFAACGTGTIDCDDLNPAINPGVPEICAINPSTGLPDGIDNDCDGLVDDSSAIDAVAYYPDADGDGFGDIANRRDSCTRPTFAAPTVRVGGDCNDGVSTVNPNANEVCFDSIDNDCDGLTDDGSAVDSVVWYRDLDNDGSGSETVTTRACSQPAGYTNNRADCDDGQTALAPGAVESCDFEDNDCSGLRYLGGPQSVRSALGNVIGRRATDRLRGVGFLADQDGDGDDELVFASPDADDGEVDAGAVYIVRGGPNVPNLDLSASTQAGPGSWDLRLFGTRRGGRFGAAVAFGNFNGDLYMDIAVGAPNARTPNIDQGAVYVYYGPRISGDLRAEDANAIIRGEAASDTFGAGLATGRFNGDAIDDLVVSAPNRTETFVRQGKVYFLYGNADIGFSSGTQSVTAQMDAWMLGNFERAALAAVANLGDIDGDNIDELGVGLPTAADLNRGEVWLVYGASSSRSGAFTPNAVLRGPARGDGYGTSFAGVGDFDDDGFDDLAFSGSQSGVTLVMGRSARFAGTVAMDTQVQTYFRGRFGQDVGASVFAAGDLNDDGYSDFAIPGSTDAVGGSGSGTVFLVYGSERSRLEEVVPVRGVFDPNRLESFGRLLPGQYFPTYSAANFTVLEGARISGIEASGFLGRTAGGGDFDGDGRQDLMITAPGSDKSGTSQDHGRVFLFPGGPYGTDVFVTDNSDILWYWDWDADTYTDVNLSTFRACEMHRPISFRDPSNPRPRGLVAPTVDLDCNDRNWNIYPGRAEAPGADGVDSDCDGYDIPNVLPFVSVEIDPSSPRAIDTLFADVNIEDTDTIITPITIEYRWYRNDVLIPGQTASTLLPNYFRAGDKVTVEARADDTRGVTAWVADFVTVENTPPRLDSCGITPANVGTTTNMSSSVAGLQDDDVGDLPALNVKYRWQKLQGGTFWFDIPGQTASTLASCAGRRVPTSDPQAALINCTVGDFIRVVCTPNDGGQDGLAVNATPVQIQNTAPVIESCAITVDGGAPLPKTNDIVRANAAGSDIDLDAVSITYEWFVNGLPTGVSSLTLDGSAWFDHFDNVQVQCTPTDARGLAGTPVLSAPITVENTAPSSASGVLVVVGGGPAFSNRDLQVQVNVAATDADGDPITYRYRWQRNGGAYPNPTFPTNVALLLEGNTIKNDIWIVSIEATDGYASAPQTNTNAVTILNTPPTVAGVVFSPSPSATRPETRENTTAIPVTFYDHDGDPNLSRVDWYVEGILEYTGPTLPPGYAERGDQVYAVYTPYDGETFGTGVTSAVFLMRNSPPEAIVLRDMSPVPAGEFDDIECNWNGPATDYDADSLTYTVEFVALRSPDPFGNPPPAPVAVTLKSSTGVSLTHPTAWSLPDLAAKPADPNVGNKMMDAIYGDQVYCRVAANDGTVNGPFTEANPVTIQDLNAPAFPSMNTVERFRNTDTVTFTGSCVSFPNDCGSLYFECINDLGQYLHSADEATGILGDCSSDVFTQTLTLPRGRDWTCWSYCIDVSNNRSINSSTRQTQVCDPFDAFELRGATVGDTQGAAVDDWSAFTDDTPASINITGNIIGSGIEFTDTEDWYLLRTLDNPTDDNADGENNYNTEIGFTAGAANYAMFVTRQAPLNTGSPIPFPAFAGPGTVVQCPTLTAGFDNYNFYNFDRGDYTHPHHGTTFLADRQRCRHTTAEYNDCENFTSNYFIRVVRTAANSCQHYTIAAVNEDPTWP